MTKSELIEEIARHDEAFSRRDLELIVNTVFDAVTTALVRGDRVEVRGFGSFSVRHRDGRRGRNPRTGEPVDIPPRRVPFFTVGKDLRERVSGGG